MNSAFRTLTSFLTLCIIAAVFSFVPAEAASERVSPYLVEEAVVIPRAESPLSSATRTALIVRDGEVVKVWVYFTDKGFTDNDRFREKAASVSFTDRAMQRRAKVGLDHIVFADLPVNNEYINSISSLGGKLRRESRWLNAASFEVPVEALDAVQALGFVARVRPVVAGKHRPLEAQSVRPDDLPNQSLAADVLNYGSSANQLTMINVDQAHQKGLSGAGVTLAIFDTGFRKSHQAFASHYNDGRVLAEHDFIFDDGNTANEGVDWSSQWNHGTYIWSTSGGHVEGTIYGPAYGANFILCKTEDVRSETQVEEDNWVAALEWVDSLGADVVTSSLSYMSWDDGTGYSVSDLDGVTAVTSIVASMAASMGIVVCNSAANDGPLPQTIGAPADAFDILTIGAVNSTNQLASFSSRGPTADGRIKPEVVAQGVSTFCASSSSDASYTTVSGTSLSTPLVAGAACLLVQAKPDYSPEWIRLALMETAGNAADPNNDIGWGLIDVNAALTWGAHFYSDYVMGEAPATVQFYDSSSLATSTWVWSFGDGDSASVQNPTHTFTEPGLYDVSLTIESSLGSMTDVKPAYIALLGDTVTFETDSAYAGKQVVMSINMVNSQPLERLIVPFKFEDNLPMTFDSAELGTRTAYFEHMQKVVSSPVSRRYAYDMWADDGGGSPALEAGSGEIMKLYFTLNPYAYGGIANVVDSALEPKVLAVSSKYMTYEPVINTGTVSTRFVIRGDLTGDLIIDISDLVYLVDYMFTFGPKPVCLQAGDIDDNLAYDIADLIYLVDYFFNEGPPPPTP